MHEHAHARPVAGGRPLHHFEITVGISERHDGAATDVSPDSHGFALVVGDEFDFFDANDDGYAVADFELRFDSTTKDLFRWDAVDRFGPRTDELDAAAGNDKRLEMIGSQVV